MSEDAMRHILVVDDEEYTRSYISELLLLEGYSVAVAANGVEAMASHAIQPADVIITDIYMPDMDGLELIKRIHSSTPEIPIVAISGGSPSQGKQFLDAAVMLGASRVIQKNILTKELSAAVKSILNSKVVAETD